MELGIFRVWYSAAAKFLGVWRAKAILRNRAGYSNVYKLMKHEE
jgi:hypothetical protein